MDELTRRIARADNRGLTRSAAREHVRGRIGNALAVGVTKQIVAFLKDATTMTSDDKTTDVRGRWREMYASRREAKTTNALAAVAVQEE